MVTCPRCGMTCSISRKGILGEHKTDQYAPGQRPGGRIRERCTYGGGTLEDAQHRISPMRRRMIDERGMRW